MADEEFERLVEDAWEEVAEELVALLTDAEEVDEDGKAKVEDGDKPLDGDGSATHV